MRLHSTATSIEKREISALAVAECIVSTAIYVAIGTITDTFLHLAVAVALGPLFLLRTELSYETALKYWAQVWDRADKEIKSPLLGIISLPLLLTSGLAIRFAVTFATLILHPRMSVKSMPDNWVRQALCTDLYYLPEIVPGEGSAEGTPSFSRIIEVIPSTWNDIRRRPFEGMFIMLPGRLLIAIVGYVPALAFRISFKATSLFYLPLIWVVGTTINTGSSLKLRLERVTKGELEKIRRRLSALVLATAAARLALGEGIVEPDYLEKIVGSKILVEKLLGSWPWWHFSIIFDAVVTFALFLLADAALARIQEDELRHAPAVDFAVKLLSFVRGVTASAIVFFFVVHAIVSVATQWAERGGLPVPV